MSHIDQLIRYAFGDPVRNPPPRGLVQFVRHISKIGFKQKPDYEMLKNLLTSAMLESGYANDGLISWRTSKKGKRKANAKPDTIARLKFPKLDVQEFSTTDSAPESPRKNKPRGTNRSHQASVHKSIFDASDVTVLDNPTPAMIEVFEMIKKRREQQQDNENIPHKNIKKKRKKRTSTTKTPNKVS